MDSLLTIGEFSKIAGVSVRTIRYYEEVQILKPAQTKDSRYRLYGKDEINKIHQILLLKKFGFSLDEIRYVFSENNNEYISKLLYDKAQVIDKEISRLNITSMVLSSFREVINEKNFLDIYISDFLIRIQNNKEDDLSMQEIVNNKYVKITVDKKRNRIFMEPRFCLDNEDNTSIYLQKALEQVTAGATVFIDFSKKDKEMFKHYGVNSFEEFCDVTRNLQPQENELQKEKDDLFTLLNEAGISRIAIKRSDDDEITELKQDIPCFIFPSVETAEKWLDEA